MWCCSSKYFLHLSSFICRFFDFQIFQTETSTLKCSISLKSHTCTCTTKETEKQLPRIGRVVSVDLRLHCCIQWTGNKVLWVFCFVFSFVIALYCIWELLSVYICRASWDTGVFSGVKPLHSATTLLRIKHVWELNTHNHIITSSSEMVFQLLRTFFPLYMFSAFPLSVFLKSGISNHTGR